MRLRTRQEGEDVRGDQDTRGSSVCEFCSLQVVLPVLSCLQDMGLERQLARKGGLQEEAGRRLQVWTLGVRSSSGISGFQYRWWTRGVETKRFVFSKAEARDGSET